MKRCPKCNGSKFVVSPHVIQDWLVDENGNYLETLDDYVETSHAVDDDDLWQCHECGYEASGKEFEV